jgi:uncharacterized protein YicC (UPF0701 family)
MAGKSKIKRLPTELREAVEKLLADPALTLEQILDHVKSLGVETSMSALQRHQKSIATVGERIRRSKAIANALVEKFGEADDDKVARLNHQVIQSAIMDLLAVADDDGAPVTLSPMQVMALSKALNELARAKRSETENTLKVRKETAKESAKAVDNVVSKMPGITKDMAAQIRQAVLGSAA